MQALVKYSKGPGNIEIREVPEPNPGLGEVKIEVKPLAGESSEVVIASAKRVLREAWARI